MNIRKRSFSAKRKRKKNIVLSFNEMRNSPSAQPAMEIFKRVPRERDYTIHRAGSQSSLLYYGLCVQCIFFFLGCCCCCCCRVVYLNSPLRNYVTNKFSQGVYTTSKSKIAKQFGKSQIIFCWLKFASLNFLSQNFLIIVVFIIIVDTSTLQEQNNKI